MMGLCLPWLLGWAMKMMAQSAPLVAVSHHPRVTGSTHLARGKNDAMRSYSYPPIPPPAFQLVFES